MKPHVRRDERGAVLVMALIFLTVGALLTAALLSFADTDFRTTVNVRSQGQELYAADAAVEAAINHYRLFGTCPSAVPPVNEVSGVSVTCTAAASTTGTPPNAPPLAVITRATQASGEDGIRLVSGAVTRIRGGAFSNNTINVSAGSILEVAGSVTARWGCNNALLITTTTGINCDIADASFPTGDDPPSGSTGYVTVVSTAPALATLPTCPASGPVLFSPGTYNDASALNALFTSCSGRVFHFKPNADGTVGAYYFDFENAGTHEWSINGPSTIVVGGVLASGVDYTNIATTAQGSRCDENQPGVQFIFGNDSRVNVNSGALELCADHSATGTAQEISVYGVKTSEAGPSAPSSTDLPAKTPTAAVSTQFSSATNGRVPDDVTADATVGSAEDDPDSITFTGFDVTGIPLGSTINEVKFVLRHKDILVSPSDATFDAHLDLAGTVSSPTGGSAALSDKTANCSPRCLTKDDELHDDTVDVSTTFDTLAKLAGMSVSYTADAKKKGNTHTSFTDHFDGVQLKVKYTPPAAPAVPRFRAQAGCITVAPYGGSGTCALVRTGGSQSDFSVHGTIYAPLAALDIHLVLVSHQVFKRGIVVRHLRSNVTPSTPCADAVPPISDDCYPFQLPGVTTTTGDVVFVAKLAGRTRLRALVAFGTGATPPTVKAWSVVNET